jgi:phosphoglycolate phosphatase
LSQVETRTRRLVLWDLDGTLVDSRGDLVEATNHAVRSLGFPPVEESHFSRMVGNGVRYLVNAALPQDAGKAVRERAIELFLDHYRQHIADRTRFFPGIREILESTRATHVVLSNKREDLCRSLIDALDVREYFSEIVGGDTYPQRKPDPFPVFQMLMRFGVPPEDAVLVGDSVVDMEAGRTAGIRTAGVTWGFGDPLEKESFTPDWLFQTVEGLGGFLREWAEARIGEEGSGPDIRPGRIR